MENNSTTIDMVNGLAEIADFMQDEELTTALTFIAKLIVKPDIPYRDWETDRKSVV